MYYSCSLFSQILKSKLALRRFQLCNFVSQHKLKVFMKRSLLLVMALFAFCATLFGQSYPPDGIEDEELRTWLKQNWYDGMHSNLGYDGARTAMYSYIDKADDGDVYCVYTGYHQAAESTTFLDPINAEHTVPQSWFSQANPMRSDIHHLYPTHKDVNSNRGSLPFGDIPDNQNRYLVHCKFQ